MTVRKTTAIASAATLALSGVISVSAPAQAAPVPAKHCVGSVTTGKTECFSSLNQALGKARKATGEVTQGTFFDNRDYGGDSFTVTGAGLCDGSDGVINYQFDFPADWFDRISSVQPWASCKIWLYPETGLNGDRDGPFTQNTGWIGTMLDDRTRSVGFS